MEWNMEWNSKNAHVHKYRVNATWIVLYLEIPCTWLDEADDGPNPWSSWWDIRWVVLGKSDVIVISSGEDEVLLENQDPPARIYTRFIDSRFVDSRLVNELIIHSLH